jgi:hypothetical protein
MTETIHIPRDIHPKATLPADRQITVWRYMDRWKFEDLIKKEKLYLCRADRLQDKFEGTYSREQLYDMDQWLTVKGYESIIDHEKKRRQVNRQRFYISSWCMSPYDLDLMWKAYTKDIHAIALKSRISMLEAICDRATEYWPLDISIVNYFGHAEGHFIDYFADGFDAFVNKDYHFELDREIRILHWRSYKPVQPESVFLPVDLSLLIECVILAPGAKSKDAEEVRKLLDGCGLHNISVESSRDDREIME